MKKDELIDRNITLTFDFIRQIIKDPKLTDDIKDGSFLEFVQKYIPIREMKSSRRIRKYYKINYQFENLG